MDTRRARSGAPVPQSDFALTTGDAPSEHSGSGACRSPGSTGSRQEAKTQCPAEKTAKIAAKAETLSAYWPSLAT